MNRVEKQFRKVLGSIRRSYTSKVYGTLRYQDYWEKRFRKSIEGMWYLGGGGFIGTGEETVIKQVAEKYGTRKVVLFDVGANKGIYTKCLMNCFCNYDIHCFEPSRATFEILRENVKSSSVKLNNVGLSNIQTDKMLYYDKEGSGIASIYKRQFLGYNIVADKSESIHLLTIDNYCEENNICHIDFLKMDVEGNEYNVLLGAEKLLRKPEVDFIQFEFGECNVDSRVFFRDFWNLLHEKYQFYRIVKDGLYEIKDYYSGLELFMCANFLCIKNGLM